MRNIIEYLNEQLLTEASTQWRTWVEGSTTVKGCDMCNCEYKKDSKYGFVCYDSDSETVSLIAVDSAEDFADALAIDVEQIKDVFDISVGGCKSKDGHMTMRIW